ncbi:MAG: 30S ribosomal protein S12 methylthiotransferase RimO [Lentisphaeria bacterium]|nr:30S ribosomal protein S12 methylthiotransferase RimO [Lentisphaeria bacterium]
MKNSSAELEFAGKIRITSLGCAKNFVDTELAAASFLCSGFALTDTETDADIQFINTCAFLQAARNEASEHIRALKNWKAAGANRKIIVAGCFIQWAKPEELAKYPYVDIWMGIDQLENAGKIALDLIRGKSAMPKPRVSARPRYIYSHETPRVQLTPGHYAYVKIADGCDNCCAYCLIPAIRGSLRSRTIESVTAEVRALIRNGVFEIILIAQDSGGFGRDRTGKPELAALLRKLDRLRGNFLLRLMYLHPASVNDELLEVLKGMKHLVRCIEMPIQHIADGVLHGMGRKISGTQTREVVRSIMDLGYAVRTTLMTGFPGETRKDFEELLQYVKDTGFARLGVFAYSREPGTRAAEMTGQVSRKTGEARAARLLEAQQEISRRNNESLLHTEQTIIIDRIIRKGLAEGRTLLDAPDIDNVVRVKYRGSLQPGDVAAVRIERAREYELEATLIRKKEQS